MASGLIALVALTTTLTGCDPNERVLVEFPGTKTRNLGPEQKAVARYPIRMAAGTTLRDLYPKPKLLDLRLDGESLPIGTHPVTIRDLAGPMLILDVAEDGLADIGTYEADIKIGSKKHTYQVVTVELVRRAASLSAPTTVRVHNEVWFPELDWCIGADLPLVGRIGSTCEPPKETFAVRVGPRAGIDHFTPTQLQATPGKVKVTSTRPDSGPAIPAGESTELQYELTGDFPLTEVDRTVVLSSPQLEQPTTLSFEVTTKRHPALIGIIIVIGGAIGALSRWLIPRLGERRQRRAAKRALAAQLRAAHEATTDHAVRTSLDHLLDRVDGVSDKDAGALAALTAIEAEWAGLEHDLDERIDVALAQRNRLDGVFGRSWTLPSGLRSDVEAVGKEIRDTIDPAIDRRDATAAEAALADAKLRATSLLVATRSWIDAYRSAVEELGTALAGSSTGRGQRVLAVTRQALAIAASANDDDPAAMDDATLVTSLSTAIRTASSFEQVHSQLVSAVGQLADAIGPELDAARPAGPSNGAEAEVVADDGFWDAPPPKASQRAAAPAAPPAPAVVTATVAPAGADAAAADAASALRAAIQRPDEVEAVLAAAKVIEAVARTEGMALGGPDAKPEDAVPAGPPPTEPAPPVPHRRTSARHRAPDVLGAFSDQATQLGAFLVQGFIALTLAVIVGYTIFLDNWTGTFADMAAVLTWALGVDLSVNAMVAYGRTLKDPGPKYDPAPAA